MLSRYLQIDDFLPVDVPSELIDYASRKQFSFVPTTTATNSPDYRRSQVLHSFPEFSQMMIFSIQNIIGEVIDKLGHTPFVVSDVESQMTLHNDGDFYRMHNDNGSPDAATREISYVYFFHKEPKQFSGGELRIYNSKDESGFYAPAEEYKPIEPWNNTIVFFLSRYWHEIMPITCPSKLFVDSRFTINGWVRRSTP